VREDEFKVWLEAGSANSEDGRKTRSYAVKFGQRIAEVVAQARDSDWNLEVAETRGRLRDSLGRQGTIAGHTKRAGSVSLVGAEPDDKRFDCYDLPDPIGERKHERFSAVGGASRRRETYA
jgi:hypothetical protein